MASTDSFLCRSSLRSDAAASWIVFCVVAASTAVHKPHGSFFVSQQPPQQCISLTDCFLCRSSLRSDAAASWIVFCVVAASTAIHKPHGSFFVSQQPPQRCISLTDRFLALGETWGLPWPSALIQGRPRGYPWAQRDTYKGANWASTLIQDQEPPRTWF